MTDHTPTPWRHANTIYVGDNGCPAIVDHLNLVICDMLDDGRDDEECRANAALIVKAVNNHEALVKALQNIAAMDPKGIRADDLGHAARIARKALAGVVGGPARG